MTSFYVDASYCPETKKCGVGIKRNRQEWSYQVKAQGSLAGELIAIIRALTMADSGDTICTDCRVALDAILQSRLLVRHEKLCEHALWLFYSYHKKEVRIKWIRRIHNMQADKLARAGRKLDN